MIVVAAKPEKPLYRVPLMAEIEAVAPNGFDAISTFSGCGGSCLGYRMAGFRMLWASEFIPAAQATYRANHPGTILDTRDIRKVKGSEILAAIGKGVGDIDLMDGSPPCASFSTAGKREAGWGKVKAYSDTTQRTDDLFFEFARLLAELKPKTFIAENVSGLVKGTAKGYFLEILAKLKACGYKVEARVLDAQWLGVPQSRKRLIFFGVRDDLGLAPAFPKPLTYRYSVREAIPWITGKFVPVDTGYVEAETDISRYAIGREWERTAIGASNDKYLNLKRCALNRPSFGISSMGGVESKAGVCHPTEKRKFSLAELRRICGFPDDFILTGTYAQGWERLGRAVPPVMMAHLAAAVRDRVLRKIRLT